MSRLKILVAVPEFPDPPHKGTTLRNYHLAKALAGQHRVRLLVARPLTDADRDRAATHGWEAEGFVPAARSSADRFRDLVTSRRPDLARRILPPALGSRLLELLATGEWDALQVEGLELAELIPLARAVPRPPRIVYDAHNVEYRLQWRAARADSGQPVRWPAAAFSLAQTVKLWAYERTIVRLADDVMAVSPEDATLLERLSDRAVLVVPNGIDCAYFQPAPRREVISGRPPGLVFCATFNYRPNVDAATWLVREIMPRVWSRRPETGLALVGRSPAPAVAALASDRVQVTGYVEDIRPYVTASDLYVVPLRAGGGTRFKVLEGMALGVAVLTTTLGAEGIGGTPGRHYAVADSAADFAAEILRLLASGEVRQNLVNAGREFVLARYDWTAITPRLLGLYEGHPHAETATAS